MVYVGSKARIADEILPIILENRKPGQLYVEPFMGGGNVICKVKGPRWGNDSNKYLIALYKALIKGWVPPIITKRQYLTIKNNILGWAPELVGYACLVCSFRGVWRGGYAGSFDGIGTLINASNYNTQLEHRALLLKQIPLLSNLRLTDLPFSKLNLSDSIIYCDPPYHNVSGYLDSFDHKLFWSWVRSVSRYNQVFVSEYHAPKDFKCIWSKEVKSNLGNSSLNKVEKLFVLK